MEEAQKPNPRTQGNRGQVKTPEPRGSKERINGQKDMAERSPSTPGHLPSFDWDEFEARYEEALANANGQEQKLLEEFEELIKYFNVWAAAASVHDTERGIKRYVYSSWAAVNHDADTPPDSRLESDTSGSQSKVCLRRRSTVGPSLPSPQIAAN